ncbi:MAG: hypothetical protein A2776_02830 [Candidatus Levybacteria bacterium RIFCSPHIGHO2_01_FULL_40_10]|nr:MAG: hypothetical protein A2776_02830 [Candidatus Levybacteria bacterium RIFCSPHIGHO2_01_FULL_40_10]
MIKKARLIKTFIDLVKIDSPSEHEDEIAKNLLSRLKKLGAKTDTDSYGNVFGFFEGIGDPFMLNSHMDTVEPGRGIKPQIKGDRIYSDGNTILGGDAKAGLTIILEALTSLVESGKKHIPINVVFTRGEESGLFGAINLNYGKLRAKQGITFDGDDDVSNVDISSPGYDRVDVTITGRGAHAGAEPERGISAIKIASEIISKLKLGRIDFETTANIGLISGGSARNAVPETVHFKGEVRSRDRKKLEKHTRHFEDVINNTMNKYPDASVNLVLEREFNPYRFEEQHPVIDKIKKAFSELKIKPNLHETGGGSDVNIFHNHGLQSIVVGIGDYEAHTTREYVVISQMVQAAEFCEKIVLA